MTPYRYKAMETDGAVLSILRKGDLVTSDQIAGVVNLSTRTIYRSIKRLRQSGVKVVGEAGVGYLLRETQPHV